MTHTPKDKTPRPPRQQNLIAFAGWLVVAITFAVGCVLILAELLFHQDNPYTSLVTYTVIPAGISAGFGIVVAGILFDLWRRRKRREARPLPIVDLNSARWRKSLAVVLMMATAFFAVSSVAVYRAFIYTESTEFCGTVCHRPMAPEHAAHQASPHARVECVACHIGPGAGWYVRSKVSGMKQAWAVTVGGYDLPIETPIHNLRPARETCEHCHWPEKFTGSIERIKWHFWYDRGNTASRVHMMMRVGGINPATGRPEGIHWHSDPDNAVWYWASDPRRLDIPYVAVDGPDGSRKVYTAEGYEGGAPAEADLRRMDCIDCHNRPAHIYRPPTEAVNLALAEGILDRKLPFLKRNAVGLLTVAYPDSETAKAAIEAGVAEQYADLDEAKRERTAAAIVEIYAETHFPEQGASWQTHPDHLGHRVFPGCFRCHDGKHKTSDGKAIRHECELCHDFVHQAYGQDAYGPVTYRTQPFEHPGGEGDMHKKSLCTECHAADVQYPGFPAAAPQ